MRPVSGTQKVLNRAAKPSLSLLLASTQGVSTPGLSGTGGDRTLVPVLVIHAGPAGETREEAPTVSTHPAFPLPRHHGPHHPADLPRHC